MPQITVRELIAKLTELPDHLQDVPVLIRSDEGGKCEIESIRPQFGEGKIWWEPDAVVLDSRY